MKNLPRWVSLLLVLLSFTTRLPAQNESLLIGPGDLLHLQVYDTPEMEQRARVTDAGTIPFSFLGSVSVSGMTPEQAAQQVARGQRAAPLHLQKQLRPLHFHLGPALGQYRLYQTIRIAEMILDRVIIPAASSGTDLPQRHTFQTMAAI